MSKPLDPKVKEQNARNRRNARIQELRDRNMSLKEIGQKVGLTGPRVYKILNKSREHTFAGQTRMSFTRQQAQA